MPRVPRRLERSRSLLVLVDMQERFRDLIHDMPLAVANCSRLLRYCERLEIPTIVTEHYPAKLGATMPELSELTPGNGVVEKISFSCCGDHLFMPRLQATRRDQIILCGIEAHVCVYQTARDLLEDGYQVIVAADATSSRQVANRNLGLAWMRDLGVQVMTSEMIMFEILKVARTEEFRAVADILSENPLPNRE